MARLTWQNVAAPNFSGVTEALRLAGQSLNTGFESAQSALDDLQSSREQRASNQLMTDVLKYGDKASLDAALKSGSLLDGRNTRNLSPEALKFLGSRGGDLLQNEQAATNLAQTQWGNQNARDREAARPAAVDLASRVNAMASDGTPEGYARAQALLQDPQNVALLSRAGWSADQVLGLSDVSKASARGGIGIQDTFNQATDSAENRNRNKAGEQLAKDAFAAAGDTGVAARNLRQRSDLAPDVLASALSQLDQFSGNFQNANADELLLQQSLNDRENEPSLDAAGFVNLVDRTEGNGDYSTLYEHAQKNGPLAGYDVSTKTIGELKDFSSRDGAYGKLQKEKLGHIATPMGRYQIVGATMNRVAKKMGLPDDTVFTPKVQNAMFQFLLDEELGTSSSMNGKMAALRRQWVGFKNVPDEQLRQVITDYTARKNLNGTDLAAQALEAVAQDRGQPANRSSLEKVVSSSTDFNNQTQGLINTVGVDSAFDTTAAVVGALTDPNSATMTRADAAQRLYEKIGDSDGIDRREVDYFMQHMNTKYGVNPGTAAALMEQAVTGTRWGARWVWGDRNLNTSIIDKVYKDVFGDNKSLTQSKINNAVANLSTRQNKQSIVTRAQELNQNVSSARQEYLNAVQRFGKGSAQEQQALLRYNSIDAAAKKELDKLQKSPSVSANINSRPDV